MVGKRIGRCRIATPIYHPIPNMTTPLNRKCCPEAGKALPSAPVGGKIYIGRLQSAYCAVSELRMFPCSSVVERAAVNR